MGYIKCSVYGCQSTTKHNKELQFHRFPRDERRQSWIEACRRPDLNEKSIEQLYNTLVCSSHFEGWMYIKKKLKSSAIPVINLPSASLHSMSTQTDAPTTEIVKELHSRSVQQETNIASVGVSAQACSSSPAAQTLNKLTDHTLQKQITNFDRKLKEDAKPTDITRQQFLQGCDKFLSPNLSRIVKAYANVKPHSKSNRYSKEFKLFCLNNLLFESTGP